MKNLFILLAILVSFGAFAQTPEKLSYQAVIRNSSNELVADTEVSMQISILQYSESGTEVYIETHSSVTNSNGLFSIEIGDGTVQSGDFTTIDWISGPYFIKTETDPTGGETYTITGVSQLLSVPYALHAKTAESLTGAITETDPVYISSQAANITEDDIINLSNLSGENTGDQNLFYLATKLALADSIALVRSEIPVVTTYSVGDFAQGGIVFWVDETGQHGLVVPKVNQSTGVRWNAGTDGNTQAKGDGLYAGESNTSIIIAAQVALGDDGNTYAARICNELQITEGDKTYGDWYLPSKEELNLMYQNETIIDAVATANGGDIFAHTYYWSSTELSNTNACFQYFPNGNQNDNVKSAIYDVRAVRAF